MQTQQQLLLVRSIVRNAAARNPRSACAYEPAQSSCASLISGYQFLSNLKVSRHGSILASRPLAANKVRGEKETAVTIVESNFPGRVQAKRRARLESETRRFS